MGHALGLNVQVATPREVRDEGFSAEDGRLLLNYGQVGSENCTPDFMPRYGVSYEMTTRCRRLGLGSRCIQADRFNAQG